MATASRIKFMGVGVLGTGFVFVVVVLVLLGSTTVDATEHCVMTRFGNPINEQMSTGWSVECDGLQESCLEIFSSERVYLADSVKAHIERKLVTDRGVPLARISNVFIRDIDTPPAIEQMRIAAVRQAQVLDSVQTQFTIDSVSSQRDLMQLTNAATAARLEGEAYAGNQQLLQLRIAETMAEGISRACSGAQVQVCVLGGSVMDTWTNMGGRQ